jgi:ATP-dependent DNA ligase
VLAGELMAFDPDGKPSQPRLCRRLLAGARSSAIVFIAFDVLAGDGRAVAGEPYRERRRRLEALDLGSP